MKLPVFSNEIDVKGTSIAVVPCATLIGQKTKGITLDQKTLESIEARGLVIAVGPNVENIVVGDLVYPSVVGSKLSITDTDVIIVDSRSIQVLYKDSGLTITELPTNPYKGIAEVEYTQSGEQNIHTLHLKKTLLQPNGDKISELLLTYWSPASIVNTNLLMMYLYYCNLAKVLDKEFSKQVAATL